MPNVAVRKRLLPANPCAGVEFPVKVAGMFRPHYMSWSEQQSIEFQAPDYLRNIIRIITESGLRVYKELMGMKKEQVDLENTMVWIPDSKTPNGIAEVPLTEMAREAFRNQIQISGPGTWLFPSDKSPTGYQKSLRKIWSAVLRKAKVPCFASGSTICDRRTRLV
jgi:integrase